MRRSGRRPLSRAARLTKEWLPFETQDEVSGKPSAALIGTGQFISSWIIDPDQALGLFDEPTVLRTLVQVMVGWNQVAAQDLIMVSFGIMVATELAQNAIDASSLERGDRDWIWQRQRVIITPPSTALSAGSDSQLVVATFDDVKTKRRLEAGQGLMACVVNEDTHLAGGSIMSFMNGRILYGH